MTRKRKPVRIAAGRACGILLETNRLPSRCGFGTFGEGASHWIDFLHEAGQRYWQVPGLPAVQQGEGESLSCFAINTQIIDLDVLVKDGLLSAADLKKSGLGGTEKLSKAELERGRRVCLKKAFESFTPDGEYMRYCGQTSDWLTDYALFLLIKNDQKGAPFWQWPSDLRLRKKESLDAYKKEHRNEILYCFFEQYIARKQWDALKAYANSKGIYIIGGLPFYTGLDSADVWAAPEMFQIDGSFKPGALPAIPPVPPAKDGHVLKNPLYQWNTMLKSHFLWWRRRFMDSLQQFDIVYIDWLREIESSYVVPAGSQSAKKGRYVKGPGAEFTTAIHKAFPSAKVIADLSGCDTAQAKTLLGLSGFTGTQVVQNSFDSAYTCAGMPYNYEYDAVVYTSLDGSGAGAWPSRVSAADKLSAAAYCAVSKQNGWSAAFARAALTSAPDTAIVPMSDYLDFDEEGGVERKSGAKSASAGQLTVKVLNTKLADKIRNLAQISGRLAQK